MRLTRKLVLLTTMALAAMALAATNASAQSAVEVIDEPSGAHCDGGTTVCGAVHITGSSELHAHTIFGEVVASECTDEFTAELNEDGTGFVHNQNLTGANCDRVACDSATESEWEILSAGETGTTGQNLGHFIIEFCLEQTGGGTEHHCTIEVDVSEPSPHHYVLSATDAGDVSGTSCPESSEVTGSWEVEPGQIEVIHS